MRLIKIIGIINCKKWIWNITNTKFNLGKIYIWKPKYWVIKND